MTTTTRKPYVHLNDQQKEQVAHFFVTGGKTVTQTWLANHFNVSRATIYNVLMEKGLIVPQEELIKLRTFARLMNEFDLDAQKLRELVDAPALTEQNIVSALLNMSRADLLDFIYQIMLAKDRMEQDQAQEEQRDAA